MWEIGVANRIGAGLDRDASGQRQHPSGDATERKREALVVEVLGVNGGVDRAPDEGGQTGHSQRGSTNTYWVIGLAVVLRKAIPEQLADSEQHVSLP